MNFKRMIVCLISLSFVSCPLVVSYSKAEAQSVSKLKKCVNQIMYTTREYVPYGESARVRTEISSKDAVNLCRNSNKIPSELKSCMNEMMYTTREYVPYGESARVRTEISSEAAAQACI